MKSKNEIISVPTGKESQGQRKVDETTRSEYEMRNGSTAKQRIQRQRVSKIASKSTTEMD